MAEVVHHRGATLSTRSYTDCFGLTALHLSLKDYPEKKKSASLFCSIFFFGTTSHPTKQEFRTKVFEKLDKWETSLCRCVTFLSHGAPDGDNEDADDGENQQCQHATYHCIRYCAVSLYHCAGI